MGHDDRSVAGLRQVARDCLKEGRHTEAFLHLSHAIKMDETNCDLLSDRSKCSLENLQYFFALEDAQTIIKLRPESWLGKSNKANPALTLHGHSVPMFVHVCPSPPPH